MSAGKSSFQSFARRDWELYGLVMAVGTMYSIAGYHLGTKSVTYSPEKSFIMKEMPWEDKDSDKVDTYKYKIRQPDGRIEMAPSALHSTKVSAKIPKHIYTKFSKKDEN